MDNMEERQAEVKRYGKYGRVKLNSEKMLKIRL